MQPNDAIRIRHMIEAAESCQRFVAGRQRHDLEADQMLLFALVRAIEIIGEAACKVSTETRTAIPEAPWPAIIAMRNRLVHAYFEIDHEVVWKTATEEFPAFFSLLRKAASDGQD